jgi:hypothetical protein
MLLDTKFQVDRLFDEAPDRFEKTRCNPVTGSRWMSDLDPIAPQLEAAYRAYAARLSLSITDPKDLPPLPLTSGERESLKVGGLTHIFAWFARSLEFHDYELLEHPSFGTYARGVMASRYAPDFIKRDRNLLKRFPPQKLDGLGRGLYWQVN